MGGVPPNIGYFQGEIIQIVIFNGFLDVNSLDYDETTLEYGNTMSAVCSLLDDNYIRYGKCQRYLNRGEVCPPPTTQVSELCISDLDRYVCNIVIYPSYKQRYSSYTIYKVVAKVDSEVLIYTCICV